MTNNTDTIVYGHGGGMYSVVPEGASPTKLAPGTYGITFNEMVGYRLTTMPDLEAPNHRVYGRQDAIVAKVIATYGKFTRSLGVLFSGDKGIGKSSTTLELARQARDIYKLPVIMVTRNTPGLANFLASLGEAVIVFDEFEKNFPISYDEQGNQDQFLTLFDGTDTTKRLYLITINDSSRISPFFLNRPGRFHYLINFDYPTQEDIRNYLIYETDGTATDEQIAEVTVFAHKARLNYDHLRAIVTELSLAPAGADIAALLADLNIRSDDDNKLVYQAEATFGDPRLAFTNEVAINLFSRDTQRLWNNYNTEETTEFLTSMGLTFPQIMHSRMMLAFRGVNIDSRGRETLAIDQETLDATSVYLVECYDQIDLAALGIHRNTPGVSLHDNETELRISLTSATLAALPRPLAEALTVQSVNFTYTPDHHGRYFAV